MDGTKIKMRIGYWALLVFFLAAGDPAHGRTDMGDPDGRTLSLTFENDVFVNVDDNYTNGVRLSLLSAINDVPRFFRWAAARSPLFPEAGDARIEYAVGQNMYTPADITLPDPPDDDRPYAGWLYGSVGMISENGSRLHQLELKLGTVGPASMADETQKFVHREITDSPDPRGWATQLPDEPVVQLTYQRSWRAAASGEWFGFQADFTPISGLGAGTVFDYLEVGSILRVGRHLPQSYGPPRIEPSLPGSGFFVSEPDVGFYLFGGGAGRLVIHNMFLDGSLFEETRSVDKKWVVVDLITGFALTWKDLRFAYTHVFRTPEFDGQSGLEEYGSATLSFRF